MYGYLILATLASTAAGSVFFDAGCPDFKPVDNFNLNSYGNGVWYEIAKYPNDAEKGASCGATEYKLDGDVFSVKSTHVAKNKLRTITGSSQLADDADNTGKLIMNLPYGAGGAITKNVFWILSTDYDNYAIGYYCKYNDEKKSRQDFAWVLGRSKTLEGDAKSSVENFLKASTFLDSSKFIWTDFSEEACKFEN